MNEWNRERVLGLVHEYTSSESLRRHMLGVELAMRSMAERYGEDPEVWGMVGLIHDYDYERYPNPERAPDREHPTEGVDRLRALGFPEAWCRAILGHASYTGVPRDSLMAKALFAVDELAGFLVACALVRPAKSLAGLEVSSVKKKLKDKAFARGVSREDVRLGAEELGVPLEELIIVVRDALQPYEEVLGLGGT